MDPTSDEVIHTAHARVANDRVHFSTTGALPSPLNATTVYCVQSVTADRYKLKACGGANIDITTSGTGTHSDYFNMKIPDTRGRNVLGTGAGTGLTARVIGASGGEENHLLTEAEMPAHTHGTNAIRIAGGGGNFLGNGPTEVNGASNTSTGGSTTHNVLDPFIVMTYIIKL